MLHGILQSWNPLHLALPQHLNQILIISAFTHFTNKEKLADKVSCDCKGFEPIITYFVNKHLTI